MTAKDCMRQVIKVVNETTEKVSELKKSDVSGDKMIDSDLEKAIMSMGFIEIKEIFNKIKKEKKNG